MLDEVQEWRAWIALTNLLRRGRPGRSNGLSISGRRSICSEKLVFADFHAAPKVSSPKRTAKILTSARDLFVSNRGFLFLFFFFFLLEGKGINKADLGPQCPEL